MSALDYSFSIIVPTYARPRHLHGCLESLARLDYPPAAFEVIIIDDGSPKPLDEVLAPWQGRLSLTLLRVANGGPGRARNAGARIARGRFLAFTDDDCRPAPDWLSMLGRQFERTPDRMLGGRTVNLVGGNPYSAASQVIIETVYAHHNRRPDESKFFASNNLAVPASLFRGLGGFDDAFRHAAAEDRELCNRWLSAGHQMSYVATAVVGHGHALTLRSFCQQHFTYGRGAWHYQRLRRQRGSGRLRDDLGFHTHLPRLLREPLARLPRGQAWSVLPLIIVSQAVYAAGFFGELLFTRRGRSER